MKVWWVGANERMEGQGRKDERREGGAGCRREKGENECGLQKREGRERVRGDEGGKGKGGVGGGRRRFFFFFEPFLKSKNPRGPLNDTWRPVIVHIDVTSLVNGRKINTLSMTLGPKKLDVLNVENHET